MYSECVDLLRSFKQNNDRINKSIGIENDRSVDLKIKSEQKQHEIDMNKINELLNKLEQSYLDPETSRKIGVVKQQYKMQKDRRDYLIESLEEDCNQFTEQTHSYQNTSLNLNYDESSH